MKYNIKFWQWIGFVAVSLFGTLLHFLYSWTGSNIVALFSAVNESTWEHMKLLFFPMLFFSIAEYFVFGKDFENFWCIKLRGILLGLALIPILFYTLRGIFGTTPDWVNIAIFFLAVAVGFIYETRQFNSNTKSCNHKWIAFSIILFIAVCFFIFTFFTPQIPLFQNPIDNTFGV